METGLDGALLAMSKVAVRWPAAWGVNRTDSVQELFGATAAVQPASLAKSAGFAPSMLTLETVSGAAPSLVTVTLDGALVVPSACGRKMSWEGDTAVWGPGSYVIVTLGAAVDVENEAFARALSA
jgi:hypothetical protein